MKKKLILFLLLTAHLCCLSVCAADKYPPPSQNSSSVLSLNTNLLYDVAFVPNIGIEFNLGKGWAIGADWKYAWWHNDQSYLYWRTYGGELNLKKYFGKSTSVLAQTGHHIGIYGQALTYDFELGYKGIRSNFSYGGGLEYGYTHPISEYLAIEFVLGIGYLGGEYKVYVPMDECYVWQETRSRHYIGPTKAGVIISYRIGRKKGGR